MRKKLYQNRATIIFWLVTALLLALVFMQMALSFISFDDFGYGSLTYAAEKPGFPLLHNVGNNYGIVDILSYLQFHYNIWGARIPSLFALIVLLKFNPVFIQLAQSVMLVLCFYLFSRIFGKETKYRIFAMIFAFCFYWLANVSIIRDGMMWYSASFIYLWTSILVAGLLILLFRRDKIPSAAKPFVLLGFFIGGWSQEFTGAMLMTAMFVYLVITFIVEHKPAVFKILCFICSVAGYLILVLAPGNKLRMAAASSNGFYDIPFITRTLSRISEEVQLLFRIELLPIVLLLLACLFVLALYLSNGGKFKLFYRCCAGITIILTAVYLIIYKFGTAMFALEAVFCVVTVVLALTLFVGQATHDKDGLPISLALGVAAAYLSGVFAPYGEARTLIPYYIFMPLLFLFVVQRCGVRLRIPAWAIITMLVILAVPSALNYSYIYCGYLNNYPSRTENVKILTKASKDIANGQSVQYIYLHKFDLTFAESNPWGDESFQQYWQHSFYVIPESVPINYIPVNFQDNDPKKPK